MAEENVSPVVPAAPASAPAGTPATPAAAAPPAFDRDTLVKDVVTAFKTDPDIAWMFNPTPAGQAEEPQDPFAPEVQAPPQVQQQAPVAPTAPVTIESIAAELKRTQDYIRQHDRAEREQSERSRAQAEFNQNVGGLVGKSALMQNLPPEQQAVVGRRMMAMAREIDQATGARLQYDALVQRVEAELNALRGIWVPSNPTPAAGVQPGQGVIPSPRFGAGSVTPTRLEPITRKGETDLMQLRARTLAAGAATTP